MMFEVIRDQKEVFSGNKEAIREWIENEMVNRFGFIVMLQENDEDEDEFVIYLHTDNGEDLSDDQWDVLEKHGISETYYETSENILKVLGLEVKPVA